MCKQMVENLMKKMCFVTLVAFVMMYYSSTIVKATEREMSESVISEIAEEVQERCIPGAPSGWVVNTTANVFLTATATTPFTNLNRGTVVQAVVGTPVTNNRRFIRYDFGGTGWVSVNHLTWSNGC